MAPKDIQVLTPGTCNCYMVKDFADVVKLRLFFFFWPRCTAGSQFSDQGLNPGLGSESLES